MAKATTKGGKVKGTGLPKGTPKFKKEKSSADVMIKQMEKAVMMGAAPQLPKDTAPQKKKKKKKVR